VLKRIWIYIVEGKDGGIVLGQMGCIVRFGSVGVKLFWRFRGEVILEVSVVLEGME
jgi:hypothetical protein